MYWNEDIIRFANILKLHRVSVNDIQRVVKITKIRTFLDTKCDDHKTMLSADMILSQVEAVELVLKIESSGQINKTLSKKKLQTAGEMFLYLINCPNQYATWINSWSIFYNYIFATSRLFSPQTTDQIILTLNRIMKTEASQHKDGKLIAAKLLKKNLMSEVLR